MAVPIVQTPVHQALNQAHGQIEGYNFANSRVSTAMKAHASLVTAGFLFNATGLVMGWPMIISTALLFTGLSWRASCAKNLQILDVLQEMGISLGGITVRGGQSGDSTHSWISHFLPRWIPIATAGIINTYDSVEIQQGQGEVEISNHDIARLVEKANASQEGIEKSEESLRFAYQITGALMCSVLALELFPVIAYVALGALATYTGQKDIAAGLVLTALVEHITGVSSLLILGAVAIAVMRDNNLSQTENGRRLLVASGAGIAAIILSRIATKALFMVFALSIPYMAFRLAQREYSSKYVNAVKSLQEHGEERIQEGAGGGFEVHLPPEAIEPPEAALVAREPARGIWEAIFGARRSPAPIQEL